MAILRFFLISVLMSLCLANNYSQNIRKEDSINHRNDSNYICNSHRITELRLLNPYLQTNNISLEIQDSAFLDSLFMANPFIIIKKKSFLFTPYSYSYDTFFEGITIKGFYRNFSFTEFLAANTNIYLSRIYFGNIQPYSYLNVSAKADLVLKLHDKFQIVGTGQVSIREGFDPKYPSFAGGANYYGMGVQFKITDKVGIGAGFTNSYYRGDWTKRTYIVPVGY
jgi:hypothetical protein